MEDFDGDIVVPYVISRTLDSYIHRLDKAMQDIEDCSRVKFVPMSYDDGQSLLVTSGNGCYISSQDCVRSRPRIVRPTISICEGCWSHGTMLHELMHAIGFEHEQQRPDRNRYLKINWDNIDKDDRVQFKKLSENAYGWDVSSFRFDFASVMLYGEYGFSRNGSKTIESKSGRPLSGNKNQLSRMDKDKLGLL